MTHFWQKLDRPILAQAPMADVTDCAFRHILAKYGKPSVLFTEFVSCDGLCSPGRKRLSADLQFDNSQRPIVAQIFGSRPDTFRMTARLIRDMGFDGVDINMGCPEKKICKQGSGSALIRTFDLAREIIYATKEGSNGLPVSVKTRLGYSRDIVEEWIANLVKAQPDTIVVHGRTKKEMSKVPANWGKIAQGAKIARKAGIIYLGNGDSKSLSDAKDKIAKYKLDGVMVGRALIGNPWLFDPEVDENSLSLKQKTDVMLEHAFLYEKLFDGIKNFRIMRKHFKAYIAGYPQIKELRMALMCTNNANEAKSIVKKHLAKHGDSFMVDPTYFEAIHR